MKKRTTLLALFAAGLLLNSCGDKEEQKQDQPKEDNIYKTVIINGEEWMAENLKATKDINGNNVTCYANTDETIGGVSDFVEKYGCLYVWEEAMKVCPSGWHLPSKDDFDSLLDYVGKNRTATTEFLSLIKNSTAWTEYSNKGVDDFGFSALPAGLYDTEKLYSFDGLGGFFWSSTQSKDKDSWAYRLGLSYNNYDIESDDKTYGFSVRCLKDSN